MDDSRITPDRADQPRLALDPPALRLLLLPLQGDEQLCSAARSFFYESMQGDPSSPAVQMAAMISVLVYATKREPTAEVKLKSPNGSHGPELEALNKMLASLAGTLKTLPVRDEIASKADLAAFQAQIRRTAEAQAKPDSELRSAMNDLLHALRHDVRGGDTLLTTWAKRLAIAAVVGLIGFLGGQLSASRQAEALQRQANARLVAAMAGLPSAASVTTYLRSKGGDLLIGPIKTADGRNAAGLIIKPGTLHFGTPAVSTAGDALVEIQP
jgi:hypothetical protein